MNEQSQTQAPTQESLTKQTPAPPHKKNNTLLIVIAGILLVTFAIFTAIITGKSNKNTPMDQTTSLQSQQPPYENPFNTTNSVSKTPTPTTYVNPFDSNQPSPTVDQPYQNPFGQ